MEIEDFRIEDIEAAPESGFVCGRVVLTIKQTVERYGGPVWSKIQVGCFIPHDGASSLDKLEEEFLREGHRLLSAAVDTLEGKDPSAMRQQAKASRDAAELRRQAELDAILGPKSPEDRDQ